MEKILEVNNLNVSFQTYAGEVYAVRGVSFSLNKGETLAVVGESGCGKTVTSKSIMRLLPPQAKIKEGSEILYKGNDILHMKEKQLKALRGSEISMIFQDPMTSLNPTAKIGDQIAESLIIHKGMKKKQALEEALNMLKTVNIPNADRRIKQYPHEFSGGMRQRAMIALALACNPGILIADEPTTALDVTIQAQIMDLIIDLQKEFSTAVILVTHDLGIVADVAHRVQVMYAGTIVERGTVEEIYYSPQHPYTWALLRSIPRVGLQSKEQLYSLKGTPPDLIKPPRGCPFFARCEFCMRICMEETPAISKLSHTHEVSCWLKCSGAPKINMPLIFGVGGELNAAR